jgi:hypothetical protein
MISRRNAIAAAASLTLSAVALSGARAADLKSPDQVKTALRLIMQVTNDFDRQITRKTYARLPHENMEFMDASGALRQAIADEPAPFKAKVEPKIKRAVDQAQKVSDESGKGDDAQLRAGHGELLKDVNAVFADFPKELRPDPNVQPGGGPPKAG